MRIKFLLIIFFISFNGSLFADIKLPAIFSDNMVLQRNTIVKIWGWSNKNATIDISFNGQKLRSKATSKGLWSVSLKPMNHGGPFEMKITNAKETIVLKNILIGDVWLGSGQSNMEWLVKNSNDADQEISAGNYEKIRFFTVDQAMGYTPSGDVTGGPWQICSSNTVGNFSAVAYFFGRKLHQELTIPIGLINSSWGGTNIEAWISWDVMSMDEAYKNLDLKKYQQKAKESQARVGEYEQALKNEKGISEKWYEAGYQPKSWKEMDLPREWGKTELGKSDGIVWFRKEITLPPGVGNIKSMLALGPIDDRDDTYVNGKLVGSTADYSQDRQYALEPGVLKDGKNVIVVRVTDTGGGGGLNGRQDQLFIDVNGARIPLNGAWDYNASVLNTDFGVEETGPNNFPSQLYNAMIAPLTGFAIKGVIWYQGEANVGNAEKYKSLFPALINDWRGHWKNDFPFLWVQLANFLAPADQPKPSSWAKLRDAQTATLSVPLTGQALAIDLGMADDIHPRNKQDVGLRLALKALKIAYGKDVVSSGPMFSAATRQGNKMKVTFSSIGGGLQAKGDRYGYVRGFAIAGPDRKFVWAKAEISDNEVIVYSDDVAQPEAVRYAWADNPADANLFNKEGLPACPFRTDRWEE